MQPKPRLLALGAHPRIRQQDRRHEVAVRQDGEDFGVDAIGLARQRREPLDLLRVGDEHLPAERLERVAHEPRAGHRLDHPTHPALRADALDQAPQAIGVRRRRQPADHVAVVADQADVKAPATEIQASVQHEDGPPRARSPVTR